MANAIQEISRFGTVALLLSLGAAPFESSVAAAPNCKEKECQIELLSYSFGGIIRGQTMRITSFNGLEPQPAPDGRRFKMLVAVVIVDMEGHRLAEGNEIEIDPGSFHSFDFHRDDFPIPGDLTTGRVQVRGEIRHRIFGIVDRTQLTPNNFPVSIELLDDETGATSVYMNPKSFQIISAGKNEGGSFPISSLGLVPGQTLRICGAHLGRPDHPDLDMNVWVNDSEGQRLLDASLRAGQGGTRCVDLSRDAIPLPGEGDSQRLQLAGRIAIADGPPDESVLLWSEVFAAETGKTQIGLLVPAIQHVRVPAGKD